MMQTEQGLVPLKWPDGWTETKRLEDSPFNCLLVEGMQSGAPVTEGWRVVTNAPAGVRMIEGVQPGIKLSEDGSGAADAGPTGKPWVEFNGWEIELERALEPKNAVWVNYGAPKPPDEAGYIRSVAEAAAYGGRWVVTLGRRLAEALENQEPDAGQAWAKLRDLSALFAQKAEWAQWPVVAVVGVVSTFKGANEFLSREFLKLASRRTLPVRVMPMERAAAMAWDGLAAVVVAEEGELPSAVAAKLKSFGGKVFLQSEKKWEEPYTMAEEVHLGLGREHDVLRTYNAASANARYTEAAGGKRGLAQVIAFGRPAKDITVAVNKRWRQARLYTPDKIAGETIEARATRFGTEFALPEFRCWAGIELEA